VKEKKKNFKQEKKHLLKEKVIGIMEYLDVT
jgi:hypothetical protein